MFQDIEERLHCREPRLGSEHLCSLGQSQKCGGVVFSHCLLFGVFSVTWFSMVFECFFHLFLGILIFFQLLAVLFSWFLAFILVPLGTPRHMFKGQAKTRVTDNKQRQMMISLSWTS